MSIPLIREPILWTVFNPVYCCKICSVWIDRWRWFFGHVSFKKGVSFNFMLLSYSGDPDLLFQYPGRPLILWIREIIVRIDLQAGTLKNKPDCLDIDVVWILRCPGLINIYAYRIRELKCHLKRNPNPWDLIPKAFVRLLLRCLGCV